MKGLNIAVVGAGAVGLTMLEVLAERNFPVKGLKLLATSRSAGRAVSFAGRSVIVEESSPSSFAGIDLAFFAGGVASEVLAREAVDRGAVVIDNSSTFRLEPEVPLVVPEVNPRDLHWHKGLIANPNCSTIIMALPLKVLADAVGIKRIVVATYQAVSGAGQEAIDELLKQTEQVLHGKQPVSEVFPYQIAFNLIPHIDVFEENNYTREEMKMVHETRKILHQEDLAISATTVRVPVLRSHSEAITVETIETIDIPAARELFREAPGIVLVDDPANKQYPMPLFATGRDEVFIGRLRQDISNEKGLCFWVSADQLRKGAATNAIQIAELLLANNLV